jgi:hypothetical protein
MQMKSMFNFELVDKDNFVSLQLEENIVYYGEIKLKFLEVESASQSLEDSKSTFKKDKKQKKKGNKKQEEEESMEVRNIYEEYKELDGNILKLEQLKEEGDLELILSHPSIEIIREGNGTMIQYQINDDVLSKYEGQWKEGQMTGSGKVVYPNQGSYAGLFCDGKRQGFGMFEWPSGEKYSGQWLDDCMQGYGVFLTRGK